MNKYELTLKELVESTFPKIKEILVVFLYGSVSRGDFSLRHSDLDLFIVLKKKKINELMKEKYDEIIIPKGYKYGVKVHPEYQSIEITYEDQTLVQKMIEEGKIIYSTGVFSFNHQLIGLKQYIIYDFSLKDAKNKTMFSKVLHGRKSWYFKNKEKVVKEYKGLIDKKNIIELGKGTLMVSKEKQKDLVHIFENFGVKYEFKRLVYA